MPDSWSAFVDDYVALHTHDPNHRLHLGLLDGLDRLPDPSLADDARQCQQARELLVRLDALPPTDDFDQSLDRDLARLTLQNAVLWSTFTWGGRTSLQREPQAGDAVGEPLFMMMINDPREPSERLSDITSRLEQVPEFLDAMLARLDEPLERWRDIDVETVQGLPSLFATVQTWAEEEEWSGQGRLATATTRAEGALLRYAEALRDMPTSRDLHVGVEIAEQIVRANGIDLSLSELHGIAKAYIAETWSKMEAFRDVLAPRYFLPHDVSLAELHKALNERHAVALPDPSRLESILEVYEQERERIRGFVKENDLFPLPEQEDMKILKTPGFLTPQIPAGAMMAPPPLRDGVPTSIVYLTLTKDRLDSHTELGIPLMMVHEGIPGHHLQLAWAALHPSPIRSMYESPHHAEGWTTMLEDYMLDAGFPIEHEDAARFSGLRDISRIGARVVIDLYFMTGDPDYLEIGVDFDRSSDDPFERAGALLAAVTGFEPARVQAELNWYSSRRGYPLSYLTGNHLVWALKEDLEAKNGSGLELDRTFHDIYLRSGNMPLTMLRRVFEHRGLL